MKGMIRIIAIEAERAEASNRLSLNFDLRNLMDIFLSKRFSLMRFLSFKKLS